ncbi:MAG TPA: ABC transporter permease [Oscillospiraceae bacterium]|nr:ABC transporter permease [Oscillospiraceae bacterium]HRW57049.1 ABC transporter permease [Oscillospiraceae bacterium]
MKKAIKKFIRKNPLAYIGILIWVLFIVCALFAPAVAPYNPYLQDLTQRFAAPGAAHLFGTDSYGRDILSRVIYGARISIPCGLLVVLLSCTFGTLYGAIAGYFGKVVDEVLMRFADMVMSFPAILLAMALAAAMGTGVVNAVIAIAVVSWPKYARLMRGMVLSIREAEYVTSERAIGQKRFPILLSTIIPNSISSQLVLASTDVGTAILTFAGLSFLGLGVSPPVAEWGYMVSDGVAILKYWWISFFPGLAIFLVSIGANFIGDAVRDIMDPRMKYEL